MGHPGMVPVPHPDTWFSRNHGATFMTEQQYAAMQAHMDRTLRAQQDFIQRHANDQAIYQGQYQQLLQNARQQQALNPYANMASSLMGYHFNSQANMYSAATAAALAERKAELTAEPVPTRRHTRTCRHCGFSREASPNVNLSPERCGNCEDK